MVNYANIAEKDFISKPLDWQKRGLSFTASGYGAKIPTQYVVKHNNRMKRVYAIQYSNAGSLYIFNKGNKLFIK